MLREAFSRTMRSNGRWPEIVRAVLFALLCTGTIIWGIVPALKKPNTDFTNYYVGARLLLDGENLSRLYDRTWFEQRIGKYGIHDQQGTFAPFPPPTALILLPLAFFGPLDAKILWTAANVVFLVGSVLILGRIIRRPWIDSGIVILLAGTAVINGLRFGQMYIFLLLLVLGGIWAAERRHDVTSGTLFGLFVPIKYFPVILLLYYAWLRRWKIVQAGIVTSGAVFLGGVLVMGWSVHDTFFHNVLISHLEGNIQDPFTATFQSWNSLLRRIFVFDPDMNLSPLFNWPLGFSFIKNGVLVGIAAITVTAIRRLGREDMRKTRLGIGLAIVAGLLVAPATATYHFILLSVPAAFFLLEFLEQDRIGRAALVLLCYSAIGVLPIGRIVQSFDQANGLLVLAYPRLWLLTILFAVTTIVTYRGVDSSLNRFRSTG